MLKILQAKLQSCHVAPDGFLVKITSLLPASTYFEFGKKSVPEGSLLHWLYYCGCYSSSKWWTASFADLKIKNDKLGSAIHLVLMTSPVESTLSIQPAKFYEWNVEWWPKNKPEDVSAFDRNELIRSDSCKNISSTSAPTFKIPLHKVRKYHRMPSLYWKILQYINSNILVRCS